MAAYQHKGQEVVRGLEEQVSRAVGFTRTRYEAQSFFLYFQAYSCTNLPAADLGRIYGRAIESLETTAPGALRGMVVSTRPDCLSPEKAELLAGYAALGLEVWLELGLQSAQDKTLARINRGHDFAAFIQAARQTEGLGLRRACSALCGVRAWSGPFPQGSTRPSTPRGFPAFWRICWRSSLGMWKS
ncbi:MAG: radical SAM protein [Spirochaetes bacterium]|nr:MAG: radical SAM protein [Spirochaetota bacterium]